MRAVVVYESMFGNTHVVADAVGRGLGETFDEVEVLAVGDATPARVADADLLVVGGPTHVHGMASGTSRRAAVQQAEDHDELHLEPHADGPGLRDWFAELPRADQDAAAFDTRLDVNALLSGRASKAIAKALGRHGRTVLDHPTSFLVGKDSHLVEGQEDEAVGWGRQLAGLAAPAR
jgi:hypothetical protein